jgi:hypothetical protein
MNSFIDNRRSNWTQLMPIAQLLVITWCHARSSVSQILRLPALLIGNGQPQCMSIHNFD